MTENDLIKYGLLAVLICIGTWFAAAINRFNRNSTVQPALKIVLVCSVALAGVTLFEVIGSSPSHALMAVTFLMAAASAMIFGMSLKIIHKKNMGLAFSDAVPDDLAVDGPYRYVRHPLYTSYCIFWIACAVIANSVAGWVLAIAICALYHRAAFSEERALLASDLGARYRAYRERTGLLMPRFPTSR